MKSIKLKFTPLALSIVIILTCFLLCGCAQVNFVTYHNYDGTIDECVYINLDPQKLIEHGYNVEQVQLDIAANSHLEAKSLIDSYQNKLSEQLVASTISNKEYAKLYAGISIIEREWQNNQYIIGLKYDSSETYQKYYQLLNNAQSAQSRQKQVKKLFYTKTYYYGTANYGDYTIFNRIYKYYSNSIFNTIPPQETSLTYSYSVSSHRYHSDANSVAKDSKGNYIHTWEIDPANPGREIKFYTISANRSPWIIACITISLASCIALCIAGLVKLIKSRKGNN